MNFHHPTVDLIGNHRSLRKVVSRLFFLLVASLPCAGEAATSEWSSTAYRIKVVILLDEFPELRETWQNSLAAALSKLLQAHFGAVWKFETSLLSAASWRCDDLPEVSHEQLREWEPAATKYDKLLVLVVNCDGRRVRLGCVEWDVRTRMLSDLELVESVALPSLDRAAATAITHVFRPIGRISSVQAKSAKIEMRAALLSEMGTDQASVTPGDILQPVNCRLNRMGEITDENVETVPWTMLRVEDRPVSLLQAREFAWCSIDSGLRSPFRVRSSRRVERYAVRVTPKFDRTVVKFVSVSDSTTPLVGYELYERRPNQSGFRSIGMSDRQGEIVVSRESDPYKILLVKHGNVLLARLPCLVGLEQEITLALPNYEERLRAEAFVQSVEDDVLDAIVKREIVISTLRRRISAEKVSEKDLQAAQKMLGEVTALNQPDRLFREIQRREATFHSDNRVVQQRIDKLFNDLRQSIRKSMSPQLIAKLEAEISEVRERSSMTNDSIDRARD